MSLKLHCATKFNVFNYNKENPGDYESRAQKI